MKYSDYCDLNLSYFYVHGKFDKTRYRRGLRYLNITCNLKIHFCSSCSLKERPFIVAQIIDILHSTVFSKINIKYL